MLVHCLTRKGEGYPPAESDDAEQMHSPPAFDPATGRPRSPGTTTWTQVFGREMVLAGAERPDVVAITAAMCGPTGLAPFAAAFPERVFDVGIAEQHALTSAAGLAMGGMHPVVAVYATFLNRAFDQLLMDCALHRLGVTVVLDRAGRHRRGRAQSPWHVGSLARRDGARAAGGGAAGRADAGRRAGRGARRLRRRRRCCASRRAPSPPDVPAVAGSAVGRRPRRGRRSRRARRTAHDRDVLLVAVGAFGELAVDAAARLAAQGIGVTVVDPRWALPVPPRSSALAAEHRLVVTVEDGGRSGGVGAAVADGSPATGVPVSVLALPQQFLEPAPRGELLAEHGLTGQAVARGITEEIARRAQDVAPRPIAAEPTANPWHPQPTSPSPSIRTPTASRDAPRGGTALSQPGQFSSAVPGRRGVPGQPQPSSAGP